MPDDRNATAGSLWRMPAAGGFFLADGEDQRAVHRQRGDGGSTGWRERHDALGVPPEVFPPGVRPRVEQRHLFAGVGIDGRLLRPLPQRTRNAGEGEVVERGGAAGGARHDVIDVKRRLLTSL